MAFSEEWLALDSIKEVGVSKVDNFNILVAKYLEGYRYAQYSPSHSRFHYIDHKQKVMSAYSWSENSIKSLRLFTDWLENFQPERYPVIKNSKLVGALIKSMPCNHWEEVPKH